MKAQGVKGCALDGCDRTFWPKNNQRYCCDEHRDANARCGGCGILTEPPTSRMPGKLGGGKYCTPCAQQRENARSLSKYGLTVEEYNTLSDAQGGVCAICRTVETARARDGSIRRLTVDHDHVTGAVRGLLCLRCNVAIGMLDDDIEKFAAAMAYLQRGQ